MCYASRIVKSQLEDLDSKRRELQNEATTYDRLMSKLYHDLEGLDLDNDSGFAIAAKMQETLRERRSIKFDINQIKSLVAQLDNVQKKLQSNEKEYFRDNKNYKKYISQ